MTVSTNCCMLTWCHFLIRAKLTSINVLTNPCQILQCMLLLAFRTMVSWPSIGLTFTNLMRAAKLVKCVQLQDIVEFLG